jgi:hypothetical protein
MVVGISIDFSCISPPEREKVYPEITQMYTDTEAKTKRRNLTTKTLGRDAGTLPKKKATTETQRSRSREKKILSTDYTDLHR